MSYAPKPAKGVAPSRFIDGKSYCGLGLILPSEEFPEDSLAKTFEYAAIHVVSDLPVQCQPSHEEPVLACTSHTVGKPCEIQMSDQSRVYGTCGMVGTSSKAPSCVYPLD